MKPISARVIGPSPTLWYATIAIDKGSSAGVRDDMPVIAADQDNGGLIGKVTNVTGDAAQVTLITDHTISVSGARHRRPANDKPPRNVDASPRAGADRGRQPERPRPAVHAAQRRHPPGDSVVSSGICSSRLTGVYPPDLPIGTRHERRRTRAPTTSRSTCARSPTCAASTSCRSSPSRSTTTSRADACADATARAAPARCSASVVVLVQVVGRLADHDLRRERRPHAARRRVRRAAVRLDARRDLRLRRRPVRRPRAAADARPHLARLHRLRLRRRAPARAARPAGARRRRSSSARSRPRSRRSASRSCSSCSASTRRSASCCCARSSRRSSSTRCSRCPSSRSCAAGCCPRCPTTRAAAAAAPTRPAACRPLSRA